MYGTVGIISVLNTGLYLAPQKLSGPPGDLGYRAIWHDLILLIVLVLVFVDCNCLLKYRCCYCIFMV